MFGMFSKKEYEELYADEFSKKIHEDKSAEIIDVRTPEEFRSGHIPNAININIMASDFLSKITNLDSSKNYYVYCQSGNRSGQACRIMTQKGLKALNLSGGIISWTGDIVW